MSAHTCHAPGCGKRVPPRMFACHYHWYRLRKPLRHAIWHEYREGQEEDKRPSLRYLAVQTLARAWLAHNPTDEASVREASELVDEALERRKEAIEAGDGDPFASIEMPWVQALCAVAELRAP